MEEMKLHDLASRTMRKIVPDKYVAMKIMRKRIMFEKERTEAEGRKR